MKREIAKEILSINPHDNPFIRLYARIVRPFNCKLGLYEMEIEVPSRSFYSIGTLEEVKEIFEKKSIGKGDKEEILKKLQRLEMQIDGNTEFIYKQFNKQMDKTVTEAKGEIEAFCQNKMNSIALAALAEHQEDFKKLENPIDMKMNE